MTIETHCVWCSSPLTENHEAECQKQNSEAWGKAVDESLARTEKIAREIENRRLE